MSRRQYNGYIDSPSPAPQARLLFSAPMTSTLTATYRDIETGELLTIDPTYEGGVKKVTSNGTEIIYIGIRAPGIIWTVQDLWSILTDVNVDVFFEFDLNVLSFNGGNTIDGYIFPVSIGYVNGSTDAKYTMEISNKSTPEYADLFHSVYVNTQNKVSFMFACDSPGTKVGYFNVFSSINGAPWNYDKRISVVRTSETDKIQIMPIFYSGGSNGHISIKNLKIWVTPMNSV